VGAAKFNVAEAFPAVADRPVGALETVGALGTVPPELEPLELLELVPPELEPLELVPPEPEPLELELLELVVAAAAIVTVARETVPSTALTGLERKTPKCVLSVSLLAIGMVIDLDVPSPASQLNVPVVGV
jgi:hypothetical protein